MLIIVLFIFLFIILVWVNKRSRQDEYIPNGFLKNIQIDSDERLIKDISVLVASKGGRVDWSHKNNLIAFSKRGSDGYADIYTMNPDGSNQVCLTCGTSGVSQLSNDQPAWHPSGEYIIFQAQDPDLGWLPKNLTQGGAGLNNNLWAVKADGSNFWQLTHIKDREATLHSHFSHDGKKLFWAARELQNGRNGKWMLKIADFIVTGNEPQLANEEIYRPIGPDAFYESHSFTLDDKQVIFSASPSDKELDLDIYKLDLVSNKLTNLTNSPGEWDEHAILSPNNKLIWISSRGYNFSPTSNWGKTLKTDFWIMNLDGSNKTKVTNFNQPGFPEYDASLRIIAADSSWNKTGDKLVATLGVVKGKVGGGVIVLIEFINPQ